MLSFTRSSYVSSCLSFYFFFFFFFNDTATTEIYPLSLHDALPILRVQIDERDGRHDLVNSSRPPLRTERSIASSTRTTATPSAPPVSGGAPDATQSRKCSHSTRSGSPSMIRGITISPSRTLARNDAKGV